MSTRYEENKGERIYTPAYDYDNILWKNIDRAIEAPTGENADRLFRTIEIMLHQEEYKEDFVKWKEANAEIEHETEQLTKQYEETVKKELKNYELDDGEAWAARKMNNRKCKEGIEATKADKIISFVLSSKIVQESFKRKGNP
ncbi:MAG: hypothetical protein SVE93_08490 [Candidatus Thermoplasmatota archaeon]|nr:hypothetical protein [Candidatus Thermoplasmatota archaeon]